jgi:4-amino-4-deoxy-L-arabinose transferase-like glycosyltransferase
MNNETMNNEQPHTPTSYSPLPTLYSLLSTPYSLLPILILLIATFLRLFQLPALPPGLNFDEAGNGVAAFDILHGEPKLWWPIGGGKEPLWPYLIALSTTILGNISLALRLPAAFVGILSVAAVYPLMRLLFQRADWQSRREAQMIALLTMLGLALSDWHLHFSRLGFRAILLPLLSTLGFYFLWWSLIKYQGSRVKDQVSRITVHPLPLNLILSSLFIALAIYAYLAARLLLLVPLLFFVCHWLITNQTLLAKPAD